MGRMPVILFLLVLGQVSYAQIEQAIGDFVEIEGARPNKLKGIGIVSGINGQGDSPKGEVVRMILNYLSRELGRPVKEIVTKNIALVSVEAELPPFAKKGTKIDVRVAVIGDAKSIKGGTLLMTPLHGPGARTEDPRIFALAQGPVSVEGDPKTGNPTVGVVKNGATIETELQHRFVKIMKWQFIKQKRIFVKQTKTVILLLKKPGFTLAQTIAEAINNQAGLFGRLDPLKIIAERPLAKALDGGSVAVRIPSPDDYKKPEEDPGYYQNEVKFIKELLSLKVRFVEMPSAKVIINDKTNTITITGNVLVKPGRIQKEGNIRIVIPSLMSLSELLGQPDIERVLKAQDIIDFIKELDKAGMILGTVETQ